MLNKLVDGLITKNIVCPTFHIHSINFHANKKLIYELIMPISN